MADSSEPNKVGALPLAFVQQAGDLASIVEKYTRAILIIYALAVFSGYVRFLPFEHFMAATAYNQSLERLAAGQIEAAKQVAVGLTGLTRVLARYERRERLVECAARFSDQKTRDWCINDAPTPGVPQ